MTDKKTKNVSKDIVTEETIESKTFDLSVDMGDISMPSSIGHKYSTGSKLAMNQLDMVTASFGHKAKLPRETSSNEIIKYLMERDAIGVATGALVKEWKGAPITYKEWKDMKSADWEKLF